MRAQSRRASLAEAVTNVAVGYILALVTQALVFPLAGIHDVSGRAHAGIGAAFVAVSLCRGYALRRLFERMLRRKDG